MLISLPFIWLWGLSGVDGHWNGGHDLPLLELPLPQLLLNPDFTPDSPFILRCFPLSLKKIWAENTTFTLQLLNYKPSKPNVIVQLQLLINNDKKKIKLSLTQILRGSYLEEINSTVAEILENI